MGGIPYRTSVDDIIQFFLPEVQCSSARIILNRDERPSGEAVAEFETEFEARSVELVFNMGQHWPLFVARHLQTKKVHNNNQKDISAS